MASAKREFLFMRSHNRSALVVLVLLSAVILLAILTPLSTPRITLNHYRAFQSMQELNRAEKSYEAQHPDTGFTCNLNDLAEPSSDKSSEVVVVDQVLASGTKSAYCFEVHCRPDAHQKATGYAITAVTTKPGVTGEYSFCSDESGEIWYSENGSTSDCLATHKPAPKKFR